MSERKWHVIYTRSRFEKKVYEELIKLGIEAYLPLYKTIKQWKDRKKLVLEPLFRSYCFVRFNENQYYTIVKIPGFVRYVRFNGKLAVVPDEEIELIRRACNSTYKIEALNNANFEVGQRVSVVRGIFSGYEGEIVQLKGKNMVLFRISNVPLSMVIQIPKNYLQEVYNKNG